MSTVTVYLSSHNISGVLTSDGLKPMDQIRKELPDCHTVTFESELSGIAAVYDAFRMTHSPDRLEERALKYAKPEQNLRSLSWNDVVEVDGVKYLWGRCSTELTGWHIL